MGAKSNRNKFLALRGRIEETYAMLYVTDCAMFNDERALWINFDPNFPLKSIRSIVKDLAIKYGAQIIMFSVGLSDYLVYLNLTGNIYYPDVIPELIDANFDNLNKYKLGRTQLTDELQKMLVDHADEELKRAKNKGR
jgi:hypothetical protein